MGQRGSTQRLQAIKSNVNEIMARIKSDDLSEEDRSRSHEILLNYIKEVRLVLSESLRASQIKKIEKLIVAALQELATLEGTFIFVQPRLKAKSLQTLHEIEKSLAENEKPEKALVKNYRRRISLIEVDDPEVDDTKNKLLSVVSGFENDIECEEKLKKLEEKHCKGRVDLGRFVGVSESSCYKKQKQHLHQLKEEINEIVDVSDKVKERKNYLLFNIDCNLEALETKVRENEEIVRKQEENYKMNSLASDNFKKLNQVVASYHNFEKSFSANCSLKDLQKIYSSLSNLKIKIDHKVKVLENQIQIQDVDPYIQLVPVKEKSLVLNQLVAIGQETEKLCQEIVSGDKFDKNSNVYKSLRKTLENYKMEVLEMSDLTDEEISYSSDILKYIEDVLVLLEENATDGDTLTDIMAINCSVLEVEKALKNAQSVNDYKSVENNLMDYVFQLKKMEIPIARRNICQFRDYVLIQIDGLLSNLAKTKNNVLMTDL